MKLVEKIIKEATLDKDVNQNKTAQAYIKKALSLVSGFPNKNTEYNPTLKFIGVYVGGFTFYFYDKDSFYSKRFGSTMGAAYDPKNNTFNIFDVTAEYNEQTKKLSLDLLGKDNEIVHEVVHFLDLKRTGVTGGEKYLAKLKNEREKGDGNVNYQRYANDPYEMNAHFQEYVMPLINKYLENKEEIPAKFEDFKKEVMQVLSKDQAIRNFYSTMTDENKKKFMKRIAVYYQSFKDYVSKDPQVKFDKNSTTLELQKDDLQKFFSKIGNLFRKKSD